MAYTGVVSAWQQEQGVGFVEGCAAAAEARGGDGDAPAEYWLYRGDIEEGAAGVEVGAEVTFDVAEGTTNAVRVVVRSKAARQRWWGIVKRWVGTANLGVILCEDDSLVRATKESFDGGRLEPFLPVSFEIVYDDDDDDGQPLAVNITGDAVVPIGSCVGTVMAWDVERGFGFIQPEDTTIREAQIWCHVKDLNDPHSGGRLVEGGRVYYDVHDRTRRDAEGPQQKAKEKAVNITGPGVAALEGMELPSNSAEAWKLVLPMGRQHEVRNYVAPVARLLIRGIPADIHWQDFKNELVFHAHCAGVGHVNTHEDSKGAYVIAEFGVMEEAHHALDVLHNRQFRDRRLTASLLQVRDRRGERDSRGKGAAKGGRGGR